MNEWMNEWKPSIVYIYNHWCPMVFPSCPHYFSNFSSASLLHGQSNISLIKTIDINHSHRQYITVMMFSSIALISQLCAKASVSVALMMSFTALSPLCDGDRWRRSWRLQRKMLKAASNRCQGECQPGKKGKGQLQPFLWEADGKWWNI